MARHWDHAEEAIFEAADEKPERDLLAGVSAVDTLEGLRVASALDAVDVGTESPAVEEVHRLRRHQGALRLRSVGVGVREEVRAEHGDIEPDDDDTARDGDLVPAEPPPHQ